MKDSNGLAQIASAGAGIALLSMGAFRGEPIGGGCVHSPRPELTYTHAPKPLSKRAMRRLRGKARA